MIRPPNEPRASLLLRLSLSALGALGALGCNSVERFDTAGDAAYCGQIVGGPLFHDGFIPDGTRPRLGLALELDTDKLTSRPGSLRSDDQEEGLCSGQGHALFEDAQMRAVGELLHDPLSTLEFGEGREHSFFAWVDSTCQGTMLSVVSLMRDDGVEIRLFKPAPLPSSNADASERPGFALFSLKRHEDGCDF